MLSSQNGIKIFVSIQILEKSKHVPLHDVMVKEVSKEIDSLDNKKSNALKFFSERESVCVYVYISVNPALRTSVECFIGKEERSDSPEFPAVEI